MGTLGLEDSDVKSLLLLNRVFRVGTDQIGRYLDIELYSPLIINELGGNSNTKTVSTPREKLQDGVRRNKESHSELRIFSAVQICMHETFVFGP